MAQAFLAQLPRISRSLLAKEDQRCPICMEDYDTTPSAHGIVECAIKLPCSHVVGSECIRTWVSASDDGRGGKNTCPLCRHVLFEAPRSIAEHLIIHSVLTNGCEDICALLGLSGNPDIGDIAIQIANSIHDRVTLAGADGDHRAAHAVAAASVYMACHLLGHPRSLTLVASCVTVGEQLVQQAYAVLHEFRYHLIDRDLLDRFGLGWNRIDEVLPSVLS